MADRIGIPVARDTRGWLHSRAAIDDVPPPYEAYKPLHCGDCAIGVVATRSYTRRKPGGGVTQVMAHYSVIKHGEHGPKCRYDFKNRAEQVIRDSRGTVVRDGDVYELRLPEPDTVEQPDRLPPSSRGRPQARSHISSSEHVLTPALGSAAEIVRLLRDFDDDPHAARRFRARYKRMKIPWDHFCHSTDESDAIASIASRLSERATLQRPLALHGTVGSAGPASSGTCYRVRDDQVGHVDYAGRKHQLYVVVCSENTDALAHLREGDRWLGYGRWKRWIGDKRRIVEIQLWVEGPWSIATWRDRSHRDA